MGLDNSCIDLKRVDLPLITFALFAYNQENYVGEAIAAALSQTYEPLEIILSDDCSSDRTFEIMQRAAAEYKGLHRIVLNCNSQNLNIGEHVNAVAKLASGDLIVLAAGDDISLPTRTEKLLNRWLEIGSPPAVLCSDFEAMDAVSKLVELPREAIYRGIYSKQAMAAGDIRVLGATTAVSRQIFSDLPSIDSSVRHEDRVLPFRAMLLGGTVSLVDEKLVRYRVEGGISRDKVISAHDYLFKHLPTLLSRMLPDAKQRLADLEFAAPNDLVLRQACLRTIADHEAGLGITQRRGVRIERALFLGLRNGARPAWLFQLYLKRRLYPLFDLYFSYRY